MDSLQYRKLPCYKYEVASAFSVALPDGLACDLGWNSEYLQISGCDLSIKPGYCWDGSSSIAIDSDKDMRASLVHDALYQLMRMGILDYKTQRKAADELYRDMCVEDGMWKVRAWWRYKAIRKGGEKFTRPQPELREAIHEAP